MGDQLKPTVAERERATTRPDPALAAACVVIVLVPFLTIAIPYRQALYAQAGVVLAVMLALACRAALRRGCWMHLKTASRPLLWASVVYALVALQGVVVGFLGGSSPQRTSDHSNPITAVVIWITAIVLAFYSL
ncbi:MAG: hypothetical protein P8Y93_13965, partial [Acidobacteriota bacterium]